VGATARTQFRAQRSVSWQCRQLRRGRHWTAALGRPGLPLHQGLEIEGKPALGAKYHLKGARSADYLELVLTRQQVTQYKGEGYLVVSDPILPVAEVAFACERIDHLFDRWNSLPRRLAPRDLDGRTRPLIAQIHRVTAIDRQLADGTLIEICGDLAAAILKVKHTWCHYDTAIYKHPGAGCVDWHQDRSSSSSGLLEHSVHFWIPLNDHTADSGPMTFVPGSHQGGLAEHKKTGRRTDVVEKTAAPPDPSSTFSVPLSVGCLSVHDPFTMHRSEPNHSDRIRKALVLQFGTGLWSAARQFERPILNIIVVHPFLSRTQQVARSAGSQAEPDFNARP
jgi:hypothetical protein